jgi:hypothetical protein
LFAWCGSAQEASYTFCFRVRNIAQPGLPRHQIVALPHYKARRTVRSALADRDCPARNVLIVFLLVVLSLKNKPSEKSEIFAGFEKLLFPVIVRERSLYFTSQCTQKNCKECGFFVLSRRCAKIW